MSLARLAAPDIDAICEAVDDSFRVGLRYSRGGNYGAGSESDWLQRWVRETCERWDLLAAFVNRDLVPELHSGEDIGCLLTGRQPTDDEREHLESLEPHIPPACVPRATHILEMTGREAICRVRWSWEIGKRRPSRSAISTESVLGVITRWVAGTIHAYTICREMPRDIDEQLSRAYHRAIERHELLGRLVDGREIVEIAAGELIGVEPTPLEADALRRAFAQRTVPA